MNSVFTVFFFITLFLPLSSFAADTIVEYDYTQEITDLTKNYDSILDYQESKRCIAYTDQDKTLCSTYEDTVVYLYKTDTSAPPTVVSKNTEQIAPNTYKIYSGDAFYQDEQTNTWKQTEYGVIEKNDFQAVQDYELKNIEEVSYLNNPFRIYRVNAQSPIYTSIDGRNYRGCGGAETFSQCSQGNGTGSDNANDIMVGWQTTGGSSYSYMFQGRVTFDTSALSDSVASSTICITAKSKYQGGSSDFNVNIYDLNPSSNTAHNNSDYENTANTAMSTGKSSDSLSNDTNYCWLLNTTGEANIDVDGYSNFGVKSENQASDTAPTPEENNIQYFYEAENTGTSKDPYILVETEVAGPECGDAECNGDETCETCEEDCGACEEEATTTLDSIPDLPFVDDLTVITGRTDHYESSTTAADWSELHYYRVPAFLWWVLTSTFLFILGFILSQIQRILRKKK